MSTDKCITRRTALKTLPFAGSVALMPTNTAATTMSAEQRMEFHLEQFQKAAGEVDPSISSWTVRNADHPKWAVAFVIAAFR